MKIKTGLNRSYIDNIHFKYKLNQLDSKLPQVNT